MMGTVPIYSVNLIRRLKIIGTVPIILKLVSTFIECLFLILPDIHVAKIED
jgi:hypothetical protein